MKTVRILLLASTAFLTANSAFAQTWTQTSAPSTNWTAIAASADGTKLVAAVAGGGIYISTNSGTSWTPTSMPQARMRPALCFVTSSADGTKLVAAIDHGGIYTSTNSGATWTLNSVSVAAWVSVASSADGNTLIVLDEPPKNAIYVSTNSGNTWVSTNGLSNFYCVASSVDGGRLVAVGDEILVSTNSGGSWTTISSPTYLSVTTVALPADRNKLIAIGGQLIFISTNAGTTWTQTSAPATNWIALASSADGSRLVAVAGGSHNLQNPIYTGPIYTSTNSGATWVSNSVPAQYWTSVASSADGNKLVAVVTGGGIWTSQSTPELQLNIKPASNNLALFWIVPSTNFVMQQSSDLSSWMDMSNPPVLNLTNLQDEVVLSPPGGNTFYRLKTQ